jgi:hypothetical protein
MRTTVGAMLVIAVLLGACAGGGASVAPPVPAASASHAVAMSASPSASIAATSEPTATGVRAYDASDTDLPAGTYATSRFRVPFTAELDTQLHIRDAGDSERFVYIGQDKNASSNADEEFDAMVLERVVDPVDQRSVGTLDGDVLRWFEDHPRFTEVDGSREEIDVDGASAVKVDFIPSDAGSCGSVHPSLQCVLVGYGPGGDEPFAVFAGSRFRIVVASHGGTPVLFAYQAADDDRFATRASVFDHWVRSVEFR